MLKAFLERLAALGDPHVAAAVNFNRPNTTTQEVSVMTEHDEREALDEEEIEEQDGEPLPDRTQMSLIHPGPGIVGPPVIGPEPPVLVDDPTNTT